MDHKTHATLHCLYAKLLLVTITLDHARTRS